MTRSLRLRRPRSSRLREDRGTATAETAIVLPVIVLLMVVIAVAGAALSLQVRLEGAARAGARELARGESTSSAQAAAVRVGGAGTQVSAGGDGTWVRVEASRTLRAPGGLLAGASWTLRADAEARLEPQLLNAAAFPDAMAASLFGGLLLAPRRRGPRRRRLLAADLRGAEGSAPAAMVAWMGMSVTVIGALSLMGLGVAAQARADTAADLAALGGADALSAGTGDPCAVAAEVAARNGARIDACAVEGMEVVITASVEAGALPRISGRARAGPGPIEEGLVLHPG